MKINGSVSIEGRKGKKAVFTNIGPASFILGPCAMESRDHALMMAENLAEIGERLSIGIVYKTSFDKANRTSSKGYRGLPLDKALRVFEDVRVQTGLPTLTDVHLPEQCSVVAEVVDILQIPAFLCRQTDLILAACNTDCIVNIKKGQFLAPWDVKGILSKTKDAKEVWITERGTSFGYNTLVVDFTGLQYMLDNFDNIVLDATHSVQKPGGQGDSSGGNRDYVPGLCRSASALGVSNFFIEVHEDPDNAPSDGPNMLKLEDFDKVVEQIVEFNYDVNSNTYSS